MNRSATASLHSATPKKNVPCISFVVVVNFFLKKERTFFFGVLPSRSRAVWRNEMRTRFCGSNFLGIWFPQNLGYFRISQAEEEGSGEESSACSIRFLLAKFGADRNQNTNSISILCL